VVSAVVVMAGYFWTLWRAGWHPGDAIGVGTRLYHAYRQATTMTFAGIVAGRIGTAFAAALIYLPPVQAVFGTAALSHSRLAVLVPFPVVVWGADELHRWRARASRSVGTFGTATPVAAAKR